jgi:molybdate transport system permease protein
MGSVDLIALWLSLRLATLTTLLLLLLSAPLAWWLAMGASRTRTVVDALVSLPLVLPPTVLGFYLLLLAPGGAIGGTFRALGLPAPAFTFAGLVIGSMLYSLPFAVQPLRDAFQGIGARPLEVAATLRASPWDRFVSVALPLSMRGILTAAVLCFAHTLGEFGVVLMIGGNIPGRTQTASIALFNHAEALEYGAAYHLSLTLLALCFLLLLTVYGANRRLRATSPLL